MLTARVIPCLDVSDGRVVKGVRFQGLRDSGDPVELAWRYEEQGADEIVILDISATPDARAHGYEVIAAVRSGLSIPLTVGGGIRKIDDAARLLDAGADKVSVNTAAVRDPGLVNLIAERFGSQCAVVAIDAALRGGIFEVLVSGGRDGTGMDAVRWAEQVAERGAGEVLLTSWDRDGTRSGYDLDLVRAVAKASRLPVIASGGAANAQHLADALNAGADAVLAASIFHGNETTVAAIKDELAALDIRVRR